MRVAKIILALSVAACSHPVPVSTAPAPGAGSGSARFCHDAEQRPTRACVDPLVILNGSRFRGTIAMLDSLDTKTIQSVEVLKGAAAFSKYGEDGRNGVVIITTKPLRL